MRKTVLFSLILTALSWLGAPAREASDPTDIATATQTTGIQQQANETYVLTGKVVDENGVPLPGVNPNLMLYKPFPLLFSDFRFQFASLCTTNFWGF